MTLDDAYTEPLHDVLSHSEGFGHREHLALAWRYLGALPVAEAHEAMAQAIRHLATLHGSPDRYHATLTQAWVRVVAVHRSRSSASSFAQFIAANDRLLDRHLLEHHYSAGLMSSDAARRAFVGPDLRALPALG